MPEKRSISERLRRQIPERAPGRCEYSLLHDEDVLLAHEVDHAIAEQHGGLTNFDNLATHGVDCYQALSLIQDQRFLMVLAKL